MTNTFYWDYNMESFFKRKEDVTSKEAKGFTLTDNQIEKIALGKGEVVEAEFKKTETKFLDNKRQNFLLIQELQNEIEKLKKQK